MADNSQKKRRLLLPRTTIEAVVKNYIRFYNLDSTADDDDDEHFAEEETTPLIEATKRRDEAAVYMLLLHYKLQQQQQNLGSSRATATTTAAALTPPASPTAFEVSETTDGGTTHSTSNMIDSKDDMGMTALHVACAEGIESITALLLDFGANIHEGDWNGETALHFACKHGQTSLVNYLIHRYSSGSSGDPTTAAGVRGSGSGSDVDDDDRGGGSGGAVEDDDDGDDQSIDASNDFHEGAVRGSSSNRSNVILSSIINKEQWHGHTPLHHAAAKGHVDIVKLLIERGGAELNVKDKDGRTPLHLASRYGHHTTVQYLLDCEGIDTTIGTTKRGHTAMHMAIEKGHDTVVGKLIPTTPKSMKQAMIQLAMERGHESIVGILNESIIAPPDL